MKWEEMRPGVMLRWKDGDYIYTVDGNGEQPYTFALRYGVDGSSRASKEYIEAGLWFLAVKKTQ